MAFRTILFAVVTLISFDLIAKESSDPKVPLSYARDIEPIFRNKCFGCHQGAKQLGEYKMTDFASLVAGGESESAAIVPGKPDESYLIDQITPVDGHSEMPKSPAKPLHAKKFGNGSLMGQRMIRHRRRDRFSTKNIRPFTSGHPHCRRSIFPLMGSKSPSRGFMKSFC